MWQMLTLLLAVLAWMGDEYDKPKSQSSPSQHTDVPTEDYEEASSSLITLIVTNVAMQITAFVLTFGNVPKISFVEYVLSLLVFIVLKYVYLEV